MGSLGAAGVPDGKRSSAEELVAGCVPGAEGASKSSLLFVAGAPDFGAGGLGRSKSSALFAVGAGAGEGVAATVAGVGVVATAAGVAFAGAGLCAQLRSGTANARQMIITLTNR